MRFMKWVSMLTVFAMLFAMLPSTVAADEINVDLSMSADDELELELGEADIIAPPEVSIEKNALELDGLKGNLSYIENENHIGTPFFSNANGDFEIDEEGTLTRYRGFEHTVVIPDGVRAIGDCAFENDNLLESVSIPTTVTYIGSEAFSGCTGLKSITIPDSVMQTGSGILYGCTELTNVQLSSNLTILSSSFFSGCNSLEAITLPSGIVQIGSYAFSGCEKLKDISIPVSVIEIHNSAFYKCNSLESVALPSGVTSIGEETFGYCDKLQSITIPACVTTIDRTAFDGSDNVVIRGEAGTYAERYANGVGIPFNAPVVTIDQETTRIYDDDDSYDALILYINQSRILTASQKPADLARALAWASSDSGIVAVDENGTIKGIAQGAATITVNTADGKGKAAQIKVVVPEPTTITIDVDWDEENVIILGQTTTISVDKEIPYSYETKVEMPIKWTSSDKSVISIESSNDNKATLKGNKLGTATITASSPDGGSASVEIRVIRPEPEGIKIDQSGPIRLYPGDKYALSASLMPAEARSKLTWYSDDKRVVSINRKGVLTAVATGWTYISVVTENGCEDSIGIEVLTPPKKVKLSRTKATLGAKETLTLTAKFTPSDALTTLTWKSSNRSVATVSKYGLVTAKKPGTAVITVKTGNGKTAKATITVKKAPNRVTLDKSGTVTLAKGKKLKLKATLPDGTASALTWSSSKPKVASVDQKGVVTAIKPGRAVITVRTFNGKAASVTITVK